MFKRNNCGDVSSRLIQRFNNVVLPRPDSPRSSRTTALPDSAWRKPLHKKLPTFFPTHKVRVRNGKRNWLAYVAAQSPNDFSGLGRS